MNDDEFKQMMQDFFAADGIVIDGKAFVATERVSDLEDGRVELAELSFVKIESSEDQ